MKETNLQMAVVPQSFLDRLEEKIENLENILRDKSESEQNSQWIESVKIPKILGVSQKTLWHNCHLKICFFHLRQCLIIYMI